MSLATVCLVNYWSHLLPFNCPSHTPINTRHHVTVHRQVISWLLRLYAEDFSRMESQFAHSLATGDDNITRQLWHLNMFTGRHEIPVNCQQMSCIRLNMGAKNHVCLTGKKPCTSQLERQFSSFDGVFACSLFFTCRYQVLCHDHDDPKDCVFIWYIRPIINVLPTWYERGSSKRAVETRARFSLLVFGFCWGLTWKRNKTAQQKSYQNPLHWNQLGDYFSYDWVWLISFQMILTASFDHTNSKFRSYLDPIKRGRRGKNHVCRGLKGFQ